MWGIKKKAHGLFVTYQLYHNQQNIICKTNKSSDKNKNLGANHSKDPIFYPKTSDLLHTPLKTFLFFHSLIGFPRLLCRKNQHFRNPLLQPSDRPLSLSQIYKQTDYHVCNCVKSTAD